MDFSPLFSRRGMRHVHRSLVTLVLVAVLGTAWLGCDVLEVDNPNSLIEDDLDNPTAARALANGLEAAVTRALEAMHSPYHTASDELTWIGSRDAWSELDIGRVGNPTNEFSDVAFPYMGEARWMAEEFIARLENFREMEELEDDRTLIRSYLNGAIIYVSVADMFDDFAFSDRREPGPAIGPENMFTLYETAVGWIDDGLALVEANELQGGDLETALYAMRARANYSRALWDKLNPDVDTADPLVNSSAAVSDARTALALMGDGDYFYQLDIISSSPDLVVGDQSQALQINNRAELGFGTAYIVPQADGTFDPDESEVIFTDLATGRVHPYVRDFILNYVTLAEFAFVNIVSKREMYLILAEAELAQGNMAGFTTEINRLRALDAAEEDEEGGGEGEEDDGLTPYTGEVDAQDLLVNSRQANLFLQGRRLADLYRFGLNSPEWTGERNAPGTFFPISITEIRANPNISR